MPPKVKAKAKPKAKAAAAPEPETLDTSLTQLAVSYPEDTETEWRQIVLLVQLSNSAGTEGTSRWIVLSPDLVQEVLDLTLTFPVWHEASFHKQAWLWIACLHSLGIIRHILFVCVTHSFISSIGFANRHIGS